MSTYIRNQDSGTKGEETEQRCKQNKLQKKREPAVPGRAAAGGITGVAAWAALLGFGGTRGRHGSAAQRRVPRAMKNARQQERRAASQIRAIEGGAAITRQRGKSCGMGASAARLRPAAAWRPGRGRGARGRRPAAWPRRRQGRRFAGRD
jgi:hypothetical protein